MLIFHVPFSNTLVFYEDGGPICMNKLVLELQSTTLAYLDAIVLFRTL